MTATKITLKTPCNLLGVFLHYPGNQKSEPLPGVRHTCELELAAGIYAIAASGTSCNPGDKVSFTVKSPANEVTRWRFVRDDGTINAWITFELNAAGAVL
jgi:hypothetical protein